MERIIYLWSLVKDLFHIEDLVKITFFCSSIGTRNFTQIMQSLSGNSVRKMCLSSSFGFCVASFFITIIILQGERDKRENELKI